MVVGRVLHVIKRAFAIVVLGGRPDNIGWVKAVHAHPAPATIW